MAKAIAERWEEMTNIHVVEWDDTMKVTPPKADSEKTLSKESVEQPDFSEKEISGEEQVSSDGQTMMTA